ncbi:NlpC/P60 family protein [Corynebacterium sphenisci]|uniref:NlpC/P60 family protein n=1 Tax=Corynebacterium sphenisci TaxID=191493 RepID=UPI0026DFB81A|nr:NlpC/P60 family protein [Corynebacterium sphenisci]MDO5729997.1 NlpC/P60 family protein [Corynebacterium sphenisci]
MRPLAGIVMAGMFASQAQFAAAEPRAVDPAEIAAAQGAADSAAGVLQSLVSQVAQTEGSLADLELELGGIREGVNRAMVDLDRANAEADRARAAVDAARGDLDGSRTRLRVEQGRFNELARAIMRQGRTIGSALGGADNVGQALERASVLRRKAEEQRAILEDLVRARTRDANLEAALRVAGRKAAAAAEAAAARKSDAEAAFAAARDRLAERQGDLERARAARDSAIAQLEAARAAVDQLHRERAAYRDEQERKRAEAAAAEAAAEAAREEAAAKAAEERAAGADSDPATAETAGAPGSTGSGATGATGADSTAESTDPADVTESGTSDSGTADSGSTGAGDADSGTTDSGTAGSGATTAPAQTAAPTDPESASPAAGSRSAKIEKVISRAMAQLGTPYAWGGGDANGPTKGIRDGGTADRHGDYNKIGFDCSGLTLYAYAGVGITLPHYTGYQYQRGTHYPVSQMQRGDLLFWGPNGHGHVAIYLGDGTMIEAPQSGSVVKISKVRYNGMTPNVVRLL